MTTIMRALRLDLQRTFSQSRWLVLALMLLGCPAIVLVAGLLGMGEGDHLGDGASGAMLGFYTVFSVYAFIYEDKYRGLWMNGIIPVSRARQVVARYLMLLVLASILVASLAVSWFVKWCFGPITFAACVFDIGGQLFSMLLVASIMYPLVYRFPPQVAVMVMAAVIVVLGVLGFAVVFGAAAVLPESATAAIGTWAVGLVSMMSTNPVGFVGIMLTVAAAALVVSACVSVHIYRAKEC